MPFLCYLASLPRHSTYEIPWFCFDMQNVLLLGPMLKKTNLSYFKSLLSVLFCFLVAGNILTAQLIFAVLVIDTHWALVSELAYSRPVLLVSPTSGIFCDISLGWVTSSLLGNSYAKGHLLLQCVIYNVQFSTPNYWTCKEMRKCDHYSRTELVTRSWLLTGPRCWCSKDFKTAIINMLKELKENRASVNKPAILAHNINYTIKRMGSSKVEKYNWWNKKIY